MSAKPKMCRLIKIRLAISIVVAAMAAFNGTSICRAQIQEPAVHHQRPDVQYRLAAGFYERGQWDEATKAFGELLNSYPNVPESPQASFYLAETMMQQHQFKAAYLRYQNFLQQYAAHPLAARAMFRMGESAFRGNKTLIAIRMLNEFTRKYPEHELNQYSLSYLGQLRLSKSEPQLAQRAFEKSLELYPNGPMASESRMGLGNALMKQGYLEEAQRLFEFCVKQNESNPSIVNEAKLQLGLLALYRQPSDHAEAQKWFAMVAEDAESATIRATAILSWARSLGESSPAEAYDLLEPVIGWELPIGIKTDLLIEGAIAASKTDRTVIAIGLLQQVRAIKPLNNKILDAVRFEVKLLESQGNVNQAIELATEFNLDVEKRSLIATTQETLGRKQYSEGDFLGSYKTFGTLLELQQADSQQQMVWRYFEALSCIGLKKFEEAEMSLRRISDDFSDESLQSLVRFCKASVKFRLEKYEAAIPYFEQYLAQDLEQDDRNIANRELAICLAKTNNAAAADTQLDALIDQGPSLGGIDDELETVVELVAQAASQNKDEHVSDKWYRYLKDHSQNSDRRMRADRHLLSRSLETPLNQQTLAGFQELFITHPQDARLVATAVENAKRLEAEGEIMGAIKWYQLALANSSAANRQVVSGMRIKIAKLAHKRGDPSDLLTAKSNLQTWLINKTSEDDVIEHEVLFQLAWVHHDLDEQTESLARFAELVQKHGNSKYWPDAAYRVAEHKVETNDYRGAKTLIAKILAVQDLPEAIYARSNFLAGKIAFTNRDWPVVETAMQAFSAKTDNAAAKLTASYFIAEALFQQQKNTQAAELFNGLQADFASLPSQYQPWVWLRNASLKLFAGDTAGAAKLATEAKQRFVDFPTSYEFDFLIARGLEAEGLLDDARLEFEKVIASPTGGETETAAHSQWRIGETYFHQENFKSAIAEYYKVDSLYAYPKWRAAALIQAAKCQEHLSNPKNAMKLYRQLLVRYPDSEFAKEARGRMSKIDSAEFKTATQNEHTTY